MKFEDTENNQIETLRREIELQLEFMLDNMSEELSYMNYKSWSNEDAIFFQFEIYTDIVRYDKIHFSFPVVRSFENVKTLAMIEFLYRHNTFKSDEYEQLISIFLEIV